MKDVLKQFCPVKVREDYAKASYSVKMHPRQCKTQVPICYSSYEDKVRHNESQTPLQAVNCDVSVCKNIVNVGSNSSMQ